MLNSNPSPSYMRDPAITAFRYVLEHVHCPWIHDFLYPSENTQRQHLQQVLQQPRRALSECSVKTIVPGDNPAVTKSTERLVLPSLSRGSLSAQYLVRDDDTGSSSYKAPRISRIVRHDKYGFILHFEEFDNGMTEVSVTILHSPGSIEHFSTVLMTKPFWETMDAWAKEGVCCEVSMQKALICTLRCHSFKTCFSCGSRSTCRCPISLFEKRHPVDFDVDRLNLSVLFGRHEMVARHAVYGSGVNLHNGISSIRIEGGFVQGAHNKEQRLEAWLVWDIFKGRENLSKLVSPLVGAQDSEPTDQASADCCADETAKGSYVLTGTSFSRDRGTASNLEVTQVCDQTVPEIADESQGLRAAEGPTIPQRHSDRIHAATISVFDGICDYGQSTVLGDSNSAPRDNVSAASIDEWGKSTGRSELPQDSQQTLPPLVISSSVHPAEQPKPDHTKSCTRGQTPMRLGKDAAHRRPIGRPPSSKMRGVTRLLMIAPATTKPTSDVEEARDEVSDESKRMRELQNRRARNRVSAAQSHERKKKREQELQENLSQAKLRVALLRQIEQDFKEKNVDLKRRFSRPGAS